MSTAELAVVFLGAAVFLVPLPIYVFFSRVKKEELAPASPGERALQLCRPGIREEELPVCDSAGPAHTLPPRGVQEGGVVSLYVKDLEDGVFNIIPTLPIFVELPEEAANDPEEEE